MAVERIDFIADTSGIAPASQQTGGYKLDKNAYSIKVTLTAALLAELEAAKGAGSLVYRFDAYSAAGGYMRTPTADLSSSIQYDLTVYDTRKSGLVRIIPVVTSVSGNEAIFEKRLGIITLTVKATPEETPDADADKKTISSLEQSAREAAAAAAVAKTICLEAQSATEAARFALEHGATFIFGGGNSQSSIGIDFVVTDEVAENSTALITSGGVFSKFAVFGAAFETHIQELMSSAAATIKSEAIAEITEKEHPIGSFIISGNAEYDPNEEYPDTVWTKIGAGRTIIDAGTDSDDNTFTLGTTGGEVSVELESSEIPAHNHARADSGGLVSVATGSGAQGFLSSSTASAGVTGSAGGGAAHNNMPPYIVTNIWRRTA